MEVLPQGQESTLKDAIDILKLTIDNQQTGFTIMMIFIAIIVLLIVAASWFFLYRIMKQQIESEYEESVKTLEADINRRLTDIDSSYREKIHQIDTSYKKEFTAFKNRMNETQGHLSRSYAIDSFENSSFDLSLKHALMALMYYNRAKDDANIRKMTDLILNVLSYEWDKSVLAPQKENYINDIKQMVPDMLGEEKSRIIMILEHL